MTCPPPGWHRTQISDSTHIMNAWPVVRAPQPLDHLPTGYQTAPQQLQPNICRKNREHVPGTTPVVADNLRTQAQEGGVHWHCDVLRQDHGPRHERTTNKLAHATIAAYKSGWAASQAALNMLSASGSARSWGVAGPMFSSPAFMPSISKCHMSASLVLGLLGGLITCRDCRSAS